MIFSYTYLEQNRLAFSDGGLESDASLVQQDDSDGKESKRSHKKRDGKEKKKKDKKEHKKDKDPEKARAKASQSHVLLTACSHGSCAHCFTWSLAVSFQDGTHMILLLHKLCICSHIAPILLVPLHKVLVQ